MNDNVSNYLCTYLVHKNTMVRGVTVYGYCTLKLHYNTQIWTEVHSKFLLFDLFGGTAAQWIVW